MMPALGVYVAALLLLYLLRRATGMFWSATAFYAATMVFLMAGFEPPMPASVIVLYGATIAVAVLLYVTSSEERRSAFLQPILAVITEPRLRPVRAVLLVLIPGVVAWQGYTASLPSGVPPPRIRSVHPSPPNSIEFRAPDATVGHSVDLIRGDNPLRSLSTSDPVKYAGHVARGRVVYFQNCFYCHGDNMAAEGHLAEAVKPPPANFQDPGTIAMLQEAFLFWRISKGGPGLPPAGTPWDSSMPVWEKMLSEEDIWSVILFMFEYTGYQPRGREEHEAK
jgi:mono/diheme cytochrome c family protein